MFITHKACRFGQERNNGLIKWRPGAAVGEIHTHPRAHPHGLWESSKPSALIGWEKLGLPEKFKTFSQRRNLLSTEFDTADRQTNRDMTTSATSTLRASAPRGEVKFCCGGMWRPHFHRSLLILIGVSDVCLAHCITLTRRDSIFPTLLNLKPCFHSNSALRLSKHSPSDWL